MIYDLLFDASIYNKAHSSLKQRDLREVLYEARDTFVDSVCLCHDLQASPRGLWMVAPDLNGVLRGLAKAHDGDALAIDDLRIEQFDGELHVVCGVDTSIVDLTVRGCPISIFDRASSPGEREPRSVLFEKSDKANLFAGGYRAWEHRHFTTDEAYRELRMADLSYDERMQVLSDASRAIRTEVPKCHTSDKEVFEEFCHVIDNGLRCYGDRRIQDVSSDYKRIITDGTFIRALRLFPQAAPFIRDAADVACRKHLVASLSDVAPSSIAQAARQAAGAQSDIDLKHHGITY